MSAPVHCAAGSDFEKNFGLTSLAAPPGSLVKRVEILPDRAAGRRHRLPVDRFRPFRRTLLVRVRLDQAGIGREAFAALVRRSAAFSRPESFDFHELAVDGDVVLAEWTIAIRRRDTGRRIEWRGMSVCRIRDGLITSWREYWNPSDLT